MLERAAGRVTLVLPPAGGMGSEEKRLLGDRVAELAYQGYGFFIVVLPPEEDSGEGSIVPGELFASRGYIGEFTAYGVAARVLDFSGSSPGELLRLARFVLGLTGPADTRLEEELSWDSLGRSIALYEDLVGRVIRGIVGQMQAEVAASSGEESLTHYTGKAVAVKVLRSRAQSIETEKNLGDIIVDVYLVTKEGRGIAMEVETFYQRPLVVRRLVELTASRLERRSSTSNLEENRVDELWVVVPPLQALLLARQLRMFMRWAWERGYGSRVRVLTYVVRAREGRRGYSVALVNALGYARRLWRVLP